MTTRIVDVRKSFGTNQILHGVDLTIETGEFVALLGASGSGKTTLLRILAGFDRPTEGEVWIDDDLVGSPSKNVATERRNLGMVFQSHALWPHLDVAAHVRFPLRYQRRSDGASAHAARVEEVLELTGLAALSSRLPHQLSGGQRQRLSLARAIASEPSLLLMDEPLSSLDANLRDDMRREIQKLHHATKASVVYVTHDQSEALAMADRVVVLNAGRAEQIASPEEVYARPATTFVARFVGKANLVRGTWSGDTFSPDCGNGRVVWNGSMVTEAFRRDGLFPVRPDELAPHPLGAEGVSEGSSPAAAAEVEGTVSTALYQGRDVEYTVQVGDEEWQILGRPVAKIGDRVRLRFRDTVPS